MYHVRIVPIANPHFSKSLVTIRGSQLLAILHKRLHNPAFFINKHLAT